MAILIYPPVRQNMTPNNEAINPSVSNDFKAIVEPIDKCVAYKFNALDVDGNELAPTTNRVDLGTELVRGETLTHEVSGGSFTAGEDYRWQLVTYAEDITISGIDTSTDVLTTSGNHNLSTGAKIYVQADALPTPLVEYTVYYVGRLSSTTIALYETSESARIDGTRIDLTSTGTNVIINNVGISNAIPFTVFSDPTLTLTSQTITSQSFTFNPAYSQAEGIPLSNFSVYVYDTNDTLVLSQLNVYSTDLRVEVTGLVSGEEVKVQYTGNTIEGQEVDTGLISFPISYSEASLDIVPTVTNLPNESAILLEMGELNTSVGVINGTSSFTSDFIDVGNYALRLDTSANCVFDDLNINPDQTYRVIWKPVVASSYDGDIFELKNSLNNNYVKIGYENSTNRFYRDINGTKFFNSSLSIESNVVYLLAITPNNLYTVKYLDQRTTLQALDSQQLGNLDSQTLGNLDA